VIEWDFVCIGLGLLWTLAHLLEWILEALEL
jgi:hypothetical protein